MSLVDQVTEQLATIELKGNIDLSYFQLKTLWLKSAVIDEDISEYITGIVEDESMEEEEKREVISEFLAEATVCW